MIDTYLFCTKDNGFYPLALKADYEAAGTWPEHGKEVSSEVYFVFSPENAPEGKMRGSDKKGNPAWVDIPPLTREEQVEIAEAKKQALIAEVHTETEMLRTKLALKRIKPDEEALLIAWLDYLDLLEALGTSLAPDIDWPQKPI